MLVVLGMLPLPRRYKKGEGQALRKYAARLPEAPPPHPFLPPGYPGRVRGEGVESRSTQAPPRFHVRIHGGIHGGPL